MSIKGTQTEKNLLKAFAGESQARNRYMFYAKIAKQEGFVQIASIFEETASQEQSHAKKFFRFLEGDEVEITARYPAGKINTTPDNLRAAVHGEHEEWEKLYPEFAEIAEKEGFHKVAIAFKMIAKVEVEHEKRFRKLLDNIEKARVFQKEEVIRWQCTKCGFVSEGTKAPDKCPACDHPQGYFQEYAENY